MANENTFDKVQIRSDLVRHLSRGLGQSEDATGLRHRDAAPISQDEHRVDDVSHQDEAGDMHALFQEIDARQGNLIKQAQELDVAPTSVVEPGAVVVMDGENYLVGVASDEFHSGGIAFSGISTSAPIYAQIQGKTAGEAFEANGTSHTIESVQ